jgi:hypothetical protein
MQKNRGQKDESYFFAQDFFACGSIGAACRFGIYGHEGRPTKDKGAALDGT